MAAKSKKNADGGVGAVARALQIPESTLSSYLTKARALSVLGKLVTARRKKLAGSREAKAVYAAIEEHGARNAKGRVKAIRVSGGSMTIALKYAPRVTPDKLGSTVAAILEDKPQEERSELEEATRKVVAELGQAPKVVDDEVLKFGITPSTATKVLADIDAQLDAVNALSG